MSKEIIVIGGYGVWCEEAGDVLTCERPPVVPSIGQEVRFKGKTRTIATISNDWKITLEKLPTVGKSAKHRKSEV
jgi:hypothetical protein